MNKNVTDVKNTTEAKESVMASGTPVAPVAVEAPQVAVQPPLVHTPPVPTAPMRRTYQNFYKRVSRGYPTQPGDTWHDLTMEQRRAWLAGHEQRWKKTFNDQQASTTHANLGWTRG